jgi:hypothetical protein
VASVGILARWLDDKRRKPKRSRHPSPKLNPRQEKEAKYLRNVPDHSFLLPNVKDSPSNTYSTQKKHHKSKVGTRARLAQSTR